MEKDALPCLNFLTKKAPYKGLSADSVEKHEPASDADAAVVDSLKALDPNRPISEADSCTAAIEVATSGLISGPAFQAPGNEPVCWHCVDGR